MRIFCFESKADKYLALPFVDKSELNTFYLPSKYSEGKTSPMSDLIKAIDR
jgi:hypothetical protein